MTWCQHQTALSSRTTAPLAATTVAVVVTMVTASSSQTPRRRHDPCVTLLGWMLEGKAALAMCVFLLLLVLRLLRRLPTRIACDVCSRLAACCGVCVCVLSGCTASHPAPTQAPSKEAHAARGHARAAAWGRGEGRVEGSTVRTARRVWVVSCGREGLRAGFMLPSHGVCRSVGPELEIDAFGNIVVNDASLVLQTVHVDDPANYIQGDDPARFTTSASFSKRSRPNHWSVEDTRQFYKVRSCLTVKCIAMAPWQR